MAALVENRVSTKKGRTTYHVLRLTVYGKKVSRSLGPIAEKTALEVLPIAQHLEDCHRGNRIVSPELETAFKALCPKLQAKIVSTGVYQAPYNPTVGEFLDDFLDGYDKGKSAKIQRERTAERLKQSVGADRMLVHVTPADAAIFQAEREQAGEKPNYVTSQIKHCKQFFKAAVDQGIIASNPFAGVTSVFIASPPPRLHEETLKVVLDGMPNEEWACLFALYRFTGCRREEALLLRWEDVDFDANNIRMPQDKTEESNGPYRDVPVFDGLLPHLKAWHDECPDNTGYVISSIVKPTDRDRRKQTSIDAKMRRTLIAAGVTPWKSLFRSLRRHRANELRWPPDVGETLEQKWLGHSAAVAHKYYYDPLWNVDYSKALAA